VAWHRHPTRHEVVHVVVEANPKPNLSHLEHALNRPFGLYAHGRSDTTGGCSLSTGHRRWASVRLSGRQAADVLPVIGDVDDQHRLTAYEPGGTISALLVTDS